MTDRVKDSWLDLQLETRIGWPVMNSMWLRCVGLVFRELQERRAQTCATCDFTDDGDWFCGSLDLIVSATFGCVNWEEATDE